MQPQELGTSKTITHLNAFLRGEMAAAASYRLALERLERSNNRSTLVQCARSHEERARLLTTAIVGRSGEPEDGFGVWSTLLRLVESSTTVIEEGAAVAALEEGENLDRDQYLDDLVGLEVSARELVEFTIIPEQRRTHEAIMAVRRSLAEGPTQLGWAMVHVRGGTEAASSSSMKRQSMRESVTPPHPAKGAGLERDRLVLLELEGAQPGAVFSLRQPSSTIGREGNADVPLRDATVSSEHARLTIDSEGAFLEDLSSRNGTFVNARRVQGPTRLDDGDYLRFGGGKTVVKFSRMGEFEERALRMLFDLTLRDSLTRLYNRRYFDDRLLREFAFASRHNSELALLLIDIDHFKKFNDDCGHQVGDIVLRLVAGSIQNLLRPEDVLARFGGEEFVILARATSLRNIEILGTRLCQRIQSLPLGLPGRELAVTVSIGASYMGPNTPSASAEELFGAADAALFEAKAGGRNRLASAGARSASRAVDEEAP